MQLVEQPLHRRPVQVLFALAGQLGADQIIDFLEIRRGIGAVRPARRGKTQQPGQDRADNHSS